MIQHELAPRTPLMQWSLGNGHRLKERRRRLSERMGRLRERVTRHQSLRLGVGGILVGVLVVAALQPQWRFAFPLTAVFFVGFALLVIRTRRLSRHLETLSKLDLFLERQLKRISGQPSGRPFESALVHARKHPNLDFAQDIGLFGSHSLWTLLDETLTADGERELIETFAAQPMTADETLNRQRQIRELRPETWFYTRLTLMANAAEFRASSAQIKELLRNPITPPGFAKAYIFSLVLWFAMIAGLIVRFTSGANPVAGWLVMAFALFNLGFLARGGSGFKKGLGLAHHLELLRPLFAAIEKRTEQSQRLREQCPATFEAGPSRQAGRLSRILWFLGVETNPLLHLVLNAAFPWSTTGTWFLERARKSIAQRFPLCLRELAKFEVAGSFLVFDKYQTRNYPEILDVGSGRASQSNGGLEFDRIFHPLIDREKVVANDFRFPGIKRLGLLTGSNMSGKSTFLRTVGLNQFLANIGAPIFAERFKTNPLKIESCIEVSDSLRDGFSYFYSEVRRIKAVLNEAHQRDGVLFLIDEIFRGTNNRERQIGSRAVIKALARARGAQGYISTHDLELASLEDTEPALMNLHFREEIRGSDMYFPYLLHGGPCPTTNALKIMEMEGIDLMNEA